MHRLYIQDIQNLPDIKPFLETLIEKQSIEVIFLYESCFQNAKILRDIIDFFCTKLGMGSKWRTRMVLVIDELNNNAIEYGSKENDINELSISMKNSQGILHIVISVCDAGTGEYAKTAQEMQQIQLRKTLQKDNSHNSVRGRGLFMIISNLVDTLSFTNKQGGGLCVCIEKKLALSES